MNEILASECSSGCESGWTLYFEHSFLSSSHKGNELVYSEGKGPTKGEDGEEDLSMVSDASSGPPIFQEDHQCYGNAGNGWCFNAPIDVENRGKVKKRSENRRRKVEEHPSFLDDTASSPIFNFTHQLNNNNLTIPSNEVLKENILDLSEGCSATHFEGRSALHEPFGFFQSPLSENQTQQNQWFEGKMGMR